MRYPASEKAEIIRLVEQSHLPAKRTLDKLGIPRATFYRWYDRYRDGGPEALADHRSRPDRVWNRIPDDVRRQIIDLPLELPELSPRELAVRFAPFAGAWIETSHPRSDGRAPSSRPLRGAWIETILCRIRNRCSGVGAWIETRLSTWKATR